MTTTASASVHASAVRVENRAVLIRGPSGAGKSHLAFDLILAGRSGQLPSAMLVGDDRVHLEASNGQVVVRPAREYMPRMNGFTAENVSVRHNRVTFTYSFK